ncbi:three-Cys-motif partner protein TcmP [Coleofasciculus sp. FACHB-712]|uniref:three-Cys-motif partner protein TcmP n=1 Tax=Coleofasciculus sp. FACHB-712 TaxID=2692789 RepID=UPI0016822467|nr:three-Cys-motif partner protein TcmP [Coleofasciculus sp. FACHB-712]MBD1943906.1 three-Cys-motif partner protein TcmP [Coleofasciculus sp. FACHB-712]
MSQFGSEGEDIIGRWSEEKLELLTKYLKAYSDIMNKQKQKWLKAYYYIDAFAGSVQPKAKDEERYVDGSPLRALRTQPGFDGYWFIDVSQQRIERLERLREEFNYNSIRIRQGDCNEILRNEVIPQITRNSKQRAIVFLDPYGLQVEWETVKALANTRTFDIFVNFSLMGVTRLLRRDSPPERTVREQLNKVMGNTDWIDQIYQPPTYSQLNLFEEQQPSLSRDTLGTEWLASLYTEHLRELFPYVSRPVIMTNSTNAAIYALCLASHNQTAVKITNDIFKRYEKLGS